MQAISTAHHFATCHFLCMAIELHAFECITACKSWLFPAQVILDA
jgi:hypothetical protein